MLFALGFQFRPSFSISEPIRSSTEISSNLPRLLALESAGIPAHATHSPVPLTSTAKPNATSFATSVRSTTTSLSLLHGQQPDVIGYSMEGKALNVYTFGSGEHQRMIVADIHGGDEWNTLTLTNQLIQYLNQSPDVIPEDVTLYILPSLNPDGEARAHNKYGRLNHNSVDLNRNFPVNWLTDWERAGCWNYLPSSGGTGPGSEVETQALMDFISNQKIEALISYHSAALGIFPGAILGMRIPFGSRNLLSRLVPIPFHRSTPDVRIQEHCLITRYQKALLLLISSSRIISRRILI